MAQIQHNLTATVRMVEVTESLILGTGNHAPTLGKLPGNVSCRVTAESHLAGVTAAGHVEVIDGELEPEVRVLRGAQQVAIYKFSPVADIVPECHGRRAVGQRAAAQQNVVPGDLLGAVVVTPIPGLSAEVATAIGE